MRIWVKSDSESSYLQATEVTTEGMPEIPVEEKPKQEKDEDHEEIQTEIAERELLKVWIIKYSHRLLDHVDVSWSSSYLRRDGDNT